MRNPYTYLLLFTLGCLISVAVRGWEGLAPVEAAATWIVLNIYLGVTGVYAVDFLLSLSSKGDPARDKEERGQSDV